MQSRTQMQPPTCSRKRLSKRVLVVFVEIEALENFLARLEFAQIEAPDIALALHQLCFGLRSFTELERAALHFVPLLEQQIDC